MKPIALDDSARFGQSRPSRGAWIETCSERTRRPTSWRRALHGARGLKRQLRPAAGQRRASRPSRGAWIETSARPAAATTATGRALHGARGLKPRVTEQRRRRRRRALHGARGLKLPCRWRPRTLDKSRPSRGAWIETVEVGAAGGRTPSRALHGARGLKRARPAEHPAGAAVAPFTGRVD